MENYIDDSHIHEGHRQRMRSKLLTHGQRIFDTYELLEMLLYHVIPYKDTNPISKRLLAAFSGLDGVLSAGRDELVAVSGVGERTADFIMNVGELSNLIGAELTPAASTNFANYNSVGEYLVKSFATQTEPAIIALLFDNNMRLIEEKKIYSIDYSSGAVKPKPFIDAALSARATVVISAHNHLYGPNCPTPGDRATNTLISESLSMAGIMHAEHYVICGNDYFGLGSARGITGRLLQPNAAEDFLNSRPRAVLDDSAHVEIYPPADARYDTRNFDYLVSLLSVIEGKKSRRTAHLLLSKFLTIENMMCASEKVLISSFSEKIAFFIKLLGYITSRRVTDGYSFGKPYTNADIAEYLKALFIGDSVEKIYLLSFDGRGRFTGCELVGEGTVNFSEVMPRKAIEAALNKSAKSVAIAHNHPLGKAEPSQDDHKFTTLFSSLFNACEITFTNHYIVAGQLCHMINVDMINIGE